MNTPTAFPFSSLAGTVSRRILAAVRACQLLAGHDIVIQRRVTAAAQVPAASRQNCRHSRGFCSRPGLSVANAPTIEASFAFLSPAREKPNSASSFASHRHLRRSRAAIPTMRIQQRHAAIPQPCARRCNQPPIQLGRLEPHVPRKPKVDANINFLRQREPSGARLEPGNLASMGPRAFPLWMITAQFHNPAMLANTAKITAAATMAATMAA